MSLTITAPEFPTFDEIMCRPVALPDGQVGVVTSGYGEAGICDEVVVELAHGYSYGPLDPRDLTLL